MIEFNKSNILRIEFSIIYWHFVDVIWLFLFIFIYWWRYLKFILIKILIC
jgi:heme/copper-type cytochrome/quinol oxidase subunit 3